MTDEFCLKMPDLHVTFRDLLQTVNLWHGTNGFTSLPKEGVLRIFSPWKIRRLRPGLNPRTWVPKARTLLLEHRSRLNLVVHECFPLGRIWPLNLTSLSLVPLPVMLQVITWYGVSKQILWRNFSPPPLFFCWGNFTLKWRIKVWRNCVCSV